MGEEKALIHVVIWYSIVIRAQSAESLPGVATRLEAHMYMHAHDAFACHSLIHTILVTRNECVGYCQKCKLHAIRESFVILR